MGQLLFNWTLTTPHSTDGPKPLYLPLTEIGEGYTGPALTTWGFTLLFHAMGPPQTEQASLCPFEAPTGVSLPTLCARWVLRLLKIGGWRTQAEGVRQVHIRPTWFRKPGVGI